jgi:hypothetical protein
MCLAVLAAPLAAQPRPEPRPAAPEAVTAAPLPPVAVTDAPVLAGTDPDAEPWPARPFRAEGRPTPRPGPSPAPDMPGASGTGPDAEPLTAGTGTGDALAESAAGAAALPLDARPPPPRPATVPIAAAPEGAAAGVAAPDAPEGTTDSATGDPAPVPLETDTADGTAPVPLETDAPAPMPLATRPPAPRPASDGTPGTGAEGRAAGPADMALAPAADPADAPLAATAPPRAVAPAVGATAPPPPVRPVAPGPGKVPVAGPAPGLIEPEPAPPPGIVPYAPELRALCEDPGILGRAEDTILLNQRGCGIAAPVRVWQVQGLSVEPPALIDCPTALALSEWVRRGVKPALRETGGGAAGLIVATSYRCPSDPALPPAPLPLKHERGQALDIAAIALRDGTRLSVFGDWSSPARGPALRRAATAACDMFQTVLTPDEGADFRTHLHLSSADYAGAPYCR